MPLADLFSALIDSGLLVPDRPRLGPMAPVLVVGRVVGREAGRLGRQLTREWGSPVHAEAGLRAWDLARSCPEQEGP